MQIRRGKIEGAQKIVIYGPEGIGKSTFASQFPNTLFIDTEGSTKHMDVARTPKPSSWTMLLDQILYIKSNPYLCNTLNLDTADWAEMLCIEHICSKSQKSGIEDFGYGKGYVYLAEEFGRLLNLLEDLVEIGINVVLVAHAQMRKFDQPDEMGSYDRWELKLKKQTAPLVKEWADMVLFANYETYVVKNDDKKNKAQGGKRVMHTTHHPCWDAKNRHDLAMKLPFDYKEIAHCIPTRENNQSLQVNTMATTFNQPQQTSQKVEEPTEQLSIDTKPVDPVKPQESTTSDSKASDNLEDVPKALADLMRANNVSVKDIQRAVSKRGYYPDNTPISNYDANFVSGVLVGAWPQVFKLIQDIRLEFEDDVPF